MTPEEILSLSKADLAAKRAELVAEAVEAREAGNVNAAKRFHELRAIIGQIDEAASVFDGIEDVSLDAPAADAPAAVDPDVPAEPSAADIDSVIAEAEAAANVAPVVASTRPVGGPDVAPDIRRVWKAGTSKSSTSTLESDFERRDRLAKAAKDGTFANDLVRTAGFDDDQVRQLGGIVDGAASPADNDRVIETYRAGVRAAKAAGEVHVASSCLQAVTNYDHPLCGDTGTPVTDEFIAVPMSRAAIRLNVPVTFTGELFTVLDDKVECAECATGECSDPAEYSMKPEKVCMELGRQTVMYNPEYIAGLEHAMQVYKDRKIEQDRLATLDAAITAAGTQFTFVGGLGSVQSLTEVILAALSTATYESREAWSGYTAFIEPGHWAKILAANGNQEMVAADIRAHILGVTGLANIVVAKDYVGPSPYPAFVAGGTIDLNAIGGLFTTNRIRVIKTDSWFHGLNGSQAMGWEQDSEQKKCDKMSMVDTTDRLFVKYGCAPDVGISLTDCAQKGAAALAVGDCPDRLQAALKAAAKASK